MDNSKKKRIIVLIILFIALVSIVLSLNRYICPPWKTGITIFDPIAATSDENNTIVLESDSRSLIILDKNKRIKNKIYLGSLDEDLLYTPSVVLKDGSYYAAIRRYNPNSSILKDEEVVKYDISGDKSEKLLTCKYPPNDTDFLQPKILDLFKKDEKCYAIVENADKNAIAVLDVSDGLCKTLEYCDITFENRIDSQIPIAMSWYDQASNKIYVMDQFGNAYAVSFGGSGYMDETADFESEDYYRSLYANSMLGIDDQYGNVISEGSTIFFDSRYDCIAHKPAEIKVVEGKWFSHETWVQIRIWMFWLGIVNIAVIAVFMIVKGIKKSIADGKLPQLKKAGIILGAGLVCLIIVIFYSLQLASVSFDQGVASQRAMVRLVKRDTEAFIVKARNEIAVKGEINPDTYNNIASILDSSSIYASKEELGVGYHLSLMENGMMCPIYFSSRNTLSTYFCRDISNVSAYDNEAVSSLTSKSLTRGLITTRTLYIDDSDNITGVLFAYTDILTVTTYFIRTCFDRFIKLFVGALAIVYAIMEFIAWKAGFRRRHSLCTEGIDFSGTALARPMFFLSTCITLADSSIIVLIIKEMLYGTIYDGNLLMYSLPMVATSLGFFIGGIITNHLFERYNVKKVLLINTSVAVLGLIAEAWSAYSNNIAVMLISRLIVSACIFSSGYYARGYTGAAPNDDIRRECAMGIAASKISSYALISIAAGYACTIWGSYTVYLISLVPALAQLLIIIFNTFEDRKSSSVQRKAGGVGLKDRIKFLLSPQIIILIVFGMFAVCFIDGYKTYVFPLLADKGGISKASISNIQVFAKAIVYFTLPLSIAYQKRVGSKNAIIINNLIIATMFLLFLLNQSVTWAVVLLIAISCVGKGIDTGILFWWQEYAKENDTNMQMAQYVMNNAEQIINIIKTPILSWLLGFGQKLSCLIIALYLFLSSFMLKTSDTINQKKHS